MLEIEKSEILSIFNDVITKEVRFTEGQVRIPNMSAEEILGVTNQLRSIARSSTVLRACGTRYGLTKDKIAFESVGAHTNLMSAIVDRVLSLQYGSNFSQTEDGFTYRDIMEVARRHDLPENVIGDIPDNGNRNNGKLALEERSFWKEFAENSPARERGFEERVKKLQDLMNLKKSFSGKLLYAADKASATIQVFEYDSMDYIPYITTAREDLSENELNAMKICDYRISAPRLMSPPPAGFMASELWMIDYFKGRELYRNDTTGLITAILIMDAIIINGKWYDWRKEDYETKSY